MVTRDVMKYPAVKPKFSLRPYMKDHSCLEAKSQTIHPESILIGMTGTFPLPCILLQLHGDSVMCGIKVQGNCTKMTCSPGMSWATGNCCLIGSMISPTKLLKLSHNSSWVENLNFCEKHPVTFNLTSPFSRKMKSHLRPTYPRRNLAVRSHYHTENKPNKIIKQKPHNN